MSSLQDICQEIGIAAVTTITDEVSITHKSRSPNGYVYRLIIVKKDYSIHNASFMDRVFEDYFPDIWDKMCMGFVAKTYLEVEDRLREEFGEYFTKMR